MRSWALEQLRCPACLNRLEVRVFGSSPEAVLTGMLLCACGEWYPVVRGVPRMLLEPLRSELWGAFAREHGAPIATEGREADPLSTVKRNTIRTFGFEWTAYERLGWDHPDFSSEREEQVFRYKSLLGPSDLKGRVALDAGCGNGRYAHWAARYGARVYAMDIGDAVEAAARNVAELQDVQVIQADIFAPPFDADIDIVFSIGALMHTGNAERATTRLATTVRPGGSLSVHLYGTGNVIYEVLDRLLRARTTRMTLEDLEELARRLYRWRGRLDSARLAGIVTRFVRLDSHPHCIFDWYSAPVASHHTYDEVRRWLEGSGFSVVASNEMTRKGVRRWLRTVVGSPTTVTLRGTRSAASGPTG